MKGAVLKKHLIQVAEKLTPESTLEDVYEQFSLLSDIEESEQQEKRGEILTHKEVQILSRERLR